MLKEYREIEKGPMEGKPVVTPIDPDTLYYKYMRKLLDVVKLIKEKRNRIIHGRACVDGSKQKRYLKEGESIS